MLAHSGASKLAAYGQSGASKLAAYEKIGVGELAAYGLHALKT